MIDALLDFIKGLFGNSPKWLKITIAVIVGLFISLACISTLASCITLDGQGELHIRPVAEDTEVSTSAMPVIYLC